MSRDLAILEINVVEAGRRGRAGKLTGNCFFFFFFCLFFHGDILLAKANRETGRLSLDHGKGRGTDFLGEGRGLDLSV